MKYEKLFTPITIAGKEIRNRIIMPSMGTNYANSDGTVSGKLIAHYTERAKNGVGLIIVEVTAVDYPRGKTIARQVKLNDYNDLPGWIDLADAVHAHGAKVICQLHHAGCMSSRDKGWGEQPVAPSDFEYNGEKARAMTTEEVEQMIEKFVKSAVLAQKAGLDGVEIHAGHGYLLGQFLSKAVNRRTDQYGGDLNGRCKILLTIIDKIRKACGDKFIISVRLGVVDTVPNGNTLEEGMQIAKLVDKAGADIINVTTGVLGLPSTGVETQYYEEGHRIPLAKAVKPVVKNAAVSIVGKIREPEMCENILEEGTADFIVLGRALLCDPMWVKKVETGRENEIRKCLSCNEGCFGNLVFKESTVRCAINPYLGLSRPLSESDIPKASRSKRVIVAGGGLAGMQAAITAAQRGHNVILLEKANQLGGQLHLACVPPGKDVLKTTIRWFAEETERQGVEVRLNQEADAETIKALNPDKVIIACGSLPSIPPIPGLDKATASWDILSGACACPENKEVVMIGGGTVGCETAILLAKKGNRLTVLEMLPVLSNGQEMTHMLDMTTEMQELGIRAVTQARVKTVTDKEVIYIDRDGNEQSLTADLFVSATGQRSVGRELCKEMKEAGIDCVQVGDSLSVGNIRLAVRTGFEAGYHA